MIFVKPQNPSLRASNGSSTNTIRFYPTGNLYRSPKYHLVFKLQVNPPTPVEFDFHIEVDGVRATLFPYNTRSKLFRAPNGLINNDSTIRFPFALTIRKDDLDDFPPNPKVRIIIRTKATTMQDPRYWSARMSSRFNIKLNTTAIASIPAHFIIESPNQ